MTNLDSILKTSFKRDIILLTKVHIVKAMVFPVVKYGYESQTMKTTEHWRTDAFKLWCWRRLLRVLWIARRSNQSILKKINPEYSLERIMLKLQYFGHLIQRVNSLEKILMLGKVEGEEKGQQRWDGWMATQTRWTWVWANSRRQWRTGRPGVCSPWGHKKSDVT